MFKLVPLVSPLDASFMELMGDPVPPEQVMHIKMLVSSSVADMRCQLLKNVEESTRELDQALEAQFGQLLSKTRGETTCNDFSTTFNDSLLSRPTSASTQSTSPGTGIAVLRLPQLPALQDDCAESRALPVYPICTDPDVEAVNASITKAPPRSMSFLGGESQVTLSVNYKTQTRMQRIVNTKAFETVFSVVILLNCLGMGLEVHEEIREEFGRRVIMALDLSEHLFTILFCIELLLRLKANGCRSFWPNKSQNWWNFLDALLVIFTGIIFTWIIPILSIVMGFSSENGVIRILTVLRGVRLIRLVRVFQRVPMFREAWLLIRGLSDSVRTLFWTCVVIGFVTYVFAILGLVLVVRDLKDQFLKGASGSEAHTELQELMSLFGGMDRLMYTLIQVLTMDSFHAIMRITLKYVWWSWVYFYAYIGVAVFVLMNLVTAIIVDNAVTKSRNDVDHELRMKEYNKSKDLKELQKLFGMMDADGSGTLSWDEFKESFGNAEMTRRWKMLDFRPEECRDIFDLLDMGQGEIETQEFFEGLCRMQGMAASKDIFRLQKTIEKLRAEVNGLSTPKAADAARIPRGKSRS